MRVLAGGLRVRRPGPGAGRRNLLSYHLRILREAGLVTGIRRGRGVDYRLDGDGFAQLWAGAAHASVRYPAN